MNTHCPPTQQHCPDTLAAHPHAGPSYSGCEAGTPVLSFDICRAFPNSKTRPLSWRKWILTRGGRVTETELEFQSAREWGGSHAYSARSDWVRMA